MCSINSSQASAGGLRSSDHAFRKLMALATGTQWCELFGCLRRDRYAVLALDGRMAVERHDVVLSPADRAALAGA